LINSSRRSFNLALDFCLAFTLVIFSGVIFASQANADEEINTNPLTATVRLQPSSVVAGQTAQIIFDLKLADHYHAYADKFKVAVDSPDDLKVGDFKLTPLVKFMDSVTHKEREGLERSGKATAVFEVPQGFKAGRVAAKVKLTYQACSKENCLFPKTITLDLPFSVTTAAGSLDQSNADVAATSVTSTSVPASASASASSSSSSSGAQQGSFEKAMSQSLFMAILVVFGMGVLTSLTPCIYPMIPITLAVLGARTKGQSKVKSFSLSLAYVFGIAFTYSILGVAAAKTGAIFGSALGNVYVVSAIALLFCVMALSMYGVFELQVPAFIRNKIGTAETGSGYGGAFATGLIAGVVASPCVGPVLVGVLTYIAQTQNLLLGFVLLFSFAMGLGLLFIVLGTSSALISKMPKAGAWMEVTKFAFGTVMVVMALYYISPIYPKWLFNTLLGTAVIMIASAYGAFEPNEGLSSKGRVRKGAMLSAFVIGLVFAGLGLLDKAGVSLSNGGGPSMMASAPVTPKLGWQKYSDQALADALAAKKPVLIDFFAEWCGACKELEHETFTDARVRDLSEKFALLQIDATDEFPGLDKLKNTYGVVGLPTMVFYDAKGQVHRELTVTGFEDADSFLKKMNGALASKTDLNSISQSSLGH
jgi:thiol:disulfide interchange protein DsbD